MKAIRDFVGWVKAHPWIMTAYAIYFAWVVVVMALKPQAFGPGLLAFGAGLVAFGSHMARTRTWIVVLLLLGLATPTKVRAETESAPVVVGIVVVVVGGIVIYKVVRFCQKNLTDTPARTNAPPDDSFTGGIYTDSDDSAASYSTSAVDYCWSETWPADSDPSCTDCDTQTNNTTSAYLPESMTTWLTSAPPPVPDDLMMWRMTAGHAAGSPVIRTMGLVPRVNGALPLISSDEFMQRIATHGISFGWGGGIAYYGKNGVPCDPAACPIQFYPRDGLPDVVISGLGQQRTLLFQRSRDLVHWSTVMRSTVPEGLAVNFDDLTRYSRAFYRVKLEAD